MLAAKIICAVVVILTVVARTVMDYFWTDKRTNRYKYTRNVFIVLAIFAALGNAAIIGFDEANKRRAAETAESKQIDFENNSLGGVAPQIWLFYYKDSKLVCPRKESGFADGDFGLHITSELGIGTAPTFALIIHNPYPFPIYDVDVTVIQESPNMDNSKSLNTVPSGYKIPILHPGKQQLVLCNAPDELFSKLVQLSVETRRGISSHTIAMMMSASNQLEYASGAIDWTRKKQIFAYKTKDFPLGTNGDIAVQVITRNFATNAVNAP